MAVFNLHATSPSRQEAATIVIYNQNDPDSKELAEYYASKRNIPTQRVIGLDAPISEEISRTDYVQRIQNPLRKIFTTNKWWKLGKLPNGKQGARSCVIYFAALIRGMPLKIASDSSVQGVNNELPAVMRTRNESSVASELVCLGMFDYPLNGAIPNPYFRRFSPIMDTDLGVSIILTSLLDGVTPADVRRMIDDSIEVEHEGLRGWAYVDARGIVSGDYAEGDQWMSALVKEMQLKGIPVIYDRNPEVFDGDFPMKDVALYYGWYAGNICGPFLKQDFRFKKGAVAVHIHSFSASTMRDPVHTWSAPLIAKGAAATLGNVYEPYLSLTTNLEVFQDRLQSGFTLAESAWMGTLSLSWMNVVIGDPLYRPFAFMSNGSSASAKAKLKNKIWIDCRKILNDAGGNSFTASPAFQAAAATTGDPVYLEFLAAAYAADGQTDKSIDTLTQAMRQSKDPDERFRLLLKRIYLLGQTNQQQAAAAFARDGQTLFPSPDKKEILKRLVNKFDPPPSPSPVAK
ncbi:MAG: TIGR03790 family protein [Chthoniobacterales bacterium]